MFYVVAQNSFHFFSAMTLSLTHSLSLPLLIRSDKDRSCQQKSAINMFYGFKLALTRICIQFHLNKSFIFKPLIFRQLGRSTTKTNNRLIVSALKFISDLIVFAKMSAMSFGCVRACASLSLLPFFVSFAFSLILPFFSIKTFAFYCV